MGKNRDGYFKEYYQKHKEEIKRRVRLYEKLHKEQVNRRSREWAQKNRGKRKESNKKWLKKKLLTDPDYKRRTQYDYRHRNMEKYNMLQREWRKNNPVLVRRQKYRRRCLETKDDYSEVSIKILLLKQQGRCIYCQKNIENSFVIEHKIPLSRGGKDCLENIDLVCRPCNTSKGRMTKEEYLAFLTNKNR